MSKEPTTISRIQVADFMGLPSLDLELPPTGVVELQGLNTDGKSSTISAMRSCLEGLRECPARPISQGKKRSQVVLTLGNGFRVERRWTNPNDRSASTVNVQNSDGMEAKKPQEMLNRLRGRITDPIAFLSWSEKEQTAHVLELVDFGEFDPSQSAALESELREGLKGHAGEIRAKRLELQTTEAEATGAPAEAVDVEELSRQLAEAETHNAQRVGLGERVAAAQGDLDQAEKDKSRADERVQEAEQLLAAAKKDAEAQANWLETCQRQLEGNTQALDDFVDMETEGLRRSLATANAKNRRFNAAERAKTLRIELEAHERQEEQATAEIDRIIAERADALQSLEFPVDGLSYDVSAGHLIYNDLPFSQASQAEVLTVVLKLAMAGDPPLRTLFATQGALLDSAHREALNTAVQEAGWQLILEVVRDEPDGKGIWIDEVKRAEPAVA